VCIYCSHTHLNDIKICNDCMVLKKLNLSIYKYIQASQPQFGKIIQENRTENGVNNRQYRTNNC